jgi:hypothetical protein
LSVQSLGEDFTECGFVYSMMKYDIRHSMERKQQEAVTGALFLPLVALR